MQEKADAVDGQEISLLDVLNFLIKYKKTILGAALIAGLLAVVVVMRMPDIYTASLKIIPPAQVQMIQSVLESERFKSNLVQQYNSNGDRNEARGQLTMVARIKAGKDGVIEVEVDDIDPKRAAALANAYPGELDKFIESIGLSDAAKQKKKIELRIQMLQKRLNDANKKLGATGQGLSVGALVNEKQKAASIAMLRAQLDVMMEGEASVNRAMPSLDKLRDQLERLFRAGSGRVNGHISDNDQEYLDQFGEVQYLEVSIESLKNRQSLLKLDEQLNNTRVLDLATVPERKSKPRRLLIVGLTMLAAGFLTILLMLLKEWFAFIRKQEHQTASV
jgi:uncharacterized protein involved in exopolysaccharide biosynthesis